MIGTQEVASSIYGAFRLASLHEDGMGLFNRTLDGFWRSFFAAVLVAPGYLAVALLEPDGGVSLSTHDAIVTGLAYVIGWVAFPVAMIPVARMLEREGRYIGYIVAYNWAAVPQMLLFVGVEVVVQGLALGTGTGALIRAAAFLAILAYYWFIARTALAIAGFAAAGVVGLDMVLTLMISAVAGGVTGAPAG